VRDEIRLRLVAEEQRSRKRMRSPGDLLKRLCSDEDYLDSAVIGGASVAQIIAGKVQETQIPQQVREAFHDQYPNLHESFVHAVQRLSTHPEQLRGLVNGVKGKVFELQYVEWLNHGHLPSGFTAELAHSANNPAWDISVKDHAGHVSELLQLKASQSLSYAMEALRLHPNIDVVIPHDVFGQVANHPELLGHVIDGGHTMIAMNSTMESSVLHSEAADIHFHFPVIGIAFIVGTSYLQYRRGAISLDEVMGKGLERSLLSVISTAAAWGSAALLHIPGVGLPVGLGARLLLGKLVDRHKRRAVLTQHVTILKESRHSLQAVLRRPLNVETRHWLPGS